MSRAASVNDHKGADVHTRRRPSFNSAPKLSVKENAETILPFIFRSISALSFTVTTSPPEEEEGSKITFDKWMMRKQRGKKRNLHFLFRIFAREFFGQSEVTTVGWLCLMKPRQMLFPFFF